MGTTVDTVGGSNNRKGRPNYPAEFKHRLAAAACKPGVSVSRLAREQGINTDRLFKWRRDLRAGLLTESESQSAHLLPVAMQRTPVRAGLPIAAVPAGSIDIVIADAVVRVSAGTDAASLQLVLHSLRTQKAPGSSLANGHKLSRYGQGWRPTVQTVSVCQT